MEGSLRKEKENDGVEQKGEDGDGAELTALFISSFLLPNMANSWNSSVRCTLITGRFFPSHYLVETIFQFTHTHFTFEELEAIPKS